MRTYLRRIFNGAHGFQMLIGLPLIILIYLGYPWLLYQLGYDTPTFGLGMFEVPMVALMYVIFNSAAAYVGAILLDDYFERYNTTGKCATHSLFSQYFWALVAIELILLLGGRAPA